MSGKDTLRLLAEELAQALVPLDEAVASPERFTALLREMGWDFAGLVPPPVAALATGVADLRAALNAVLASDPTPEELNDLGTAIRNLVDAVRELAHQPPGSFPAELEAVGFVDEFPARLVQLLVVTHLQHNHPRVETLLRVLGIVRVELVPATGDRPSYVARLLALPDLAELLRDPVLVLERVYGWGTADFRYQDVFEHVADLAAAFGLDVYLDELDPRLVLLLEAGAVVPGRPVRWSLKAPLLVGEVAGAPVEAGVGLFALPAQGAHLPGLSLLPYAEGELQERVQLSERVSLVIETDADLTAGAGVVLRPHEPIEVLTELIPSADAGVAPPSGGRVRVRLEVGEADSGPTVLLGAGGVGRVEVSRISLTGEAEVDSIGGRELSFELDLQAALLIEPDEADSFVRSILPAEGLQAKFDLGLAWSNERGLSFRGAGSLDATLPVGLSIRGVLMVPTIHLSLHAGDTGLAAEVLASVGVSIGPIHAAIERVGMAAAVTFPETGGNVGVANLDFRFKPPNGMGLVIDAPTVVGGGYLSFDPQKEEYSGILELQIGERIAVKALGLLTTRMPDGGKGYSLVVIIFAQGFKPIPLGLGFSLTGIGGLLAINRTFDEEALRAGLKQHTLDSVMFPTDLISNAPQILSNVNRVFPPANGHHLFGPMAQIAWGTPPRITADLALVAEFGARLRLLILAQVVAILPRPDHELVRLQMDAMGVLDFDQGSAALDATLYDSRLLKKFALTGDMAMRLTWGASPNFALAIGGLHPAFNPPPKFPKLERIAINLSAGDNPRFRCEAYFALASNAVQFGARAELYATAAGFSILGEIAFDVLIQPPKFSIDFYAQLQLKRGKTNLFKVRVEGALAGPLPLHIKAKATFEVFWLDVSIRVDKTLLGGATPSLPALIDVLPLLREALSHLGNWSGQLPDRQRSMVTLRARPGAATEVLLHPLGTLMVKQSVVPLNLEISRFGEAAPAGARRFTVSVNLGGQHQTTQSVRDFFAPAQFFEMSDDEKLSRPSFESLAAGLSMGSDAFLFSTDADDLLEVAHIEFETIIVDQQGQESRRSASKDLYRLSPKRLGKQARFGAAGTSDIRRTGQAKYRTTTLKHRVAKEGWSLVATDDLSVQPVPGMDDGQPASYSEAAQALRHLHQQDPAKAARVKILRLSEVR